MEELWPGRDGYKNLSRNDQRRNRSENQSCPGSNGTSKRDVRAGLLFQNLIRMMNRFSKMTSRLSAVILLGALGLLPWRAEEAGFFNGKDFAKY